MSDGHRLCLRLDLLDELVLSERAATAGGHRSLDYLPGATLLGALAARLYRRLDEQDLAFTAFHSGRLRFGNGLPLDEEGRLCWPMPLQLHHDKGVPPAGFLGARRAESLVLAEGADAAEMTQKEQLRDGYVSADLHVFRPALTFAMKTGIDPRYGRARDQQLFGYEALASRQSFVAEIEADAEPAAEAALAAVERSLRDDPVLRLGRSRSAEFGRVEVALLDERPPAPPQRSGTDGRLRLWALSDLCLLDAEGRPALTPEAALLGFAQAAIDRRRTFVRTRRYAPFNGHWGHYGPERAVIAQGSVITLTGPGLDDAGARAALARGLGLFRECGLGRLALDPWILAGDHPQAAEAPRVPRRQETAAAPSETAPLIRWLREKRDVSAGAAARADEVARKLKELKGLYRSASLWARGDEGADIGPGVSQWNAVRGAAERFGDAPDALRERLFGPKGLARLAREAPEEEGAEEEAAEEEAEKADPIWGTRYGVDEPGQEATFAAWLLRLFEELSARPDGLLRLLPELAKQAAEFRRGRRQG